MRPAPRLQNGAPTHTRTLGQLHWARCNDRSVSGRRRRARRDLICLAMLRLRASWATSGPARLESTRARTDPDSDSGSDFDFDTARCGGSSRVSIATAETVCESARPSLFIMQAGERERAGGPAAGQITGASRSDRRLIAARCTLPSDRSGPRAKQPAAAV